MVVRLPPWCEETSDLTPDFETVVIARAVRDKLLAAAAPATAASAAATTTTATTTTTSPAAAASASAQNAASKSSTKQQKRRLGKLLAIYGGDVEAVCRTLEETARWDGRKRHSKLGVAGQWVLRLGDWDFGLKYPPPPSLTGGGGAGGGSGGGGGGGGGSGRKDSSRVVEVFDCWHPGQVLFDPEVGEIVEVDEANPMHRLHLERLAEEEEGEHVE